MPKVPDFAGKLSRFSPAARERMTWLRERFIPMANAWGSNVLMFARKLGCVP
jgi:hypothetical protein